MRVHFLAGIQLEQSGRHLTRQPMGNRPHGRKESLVSKNQARQRFFSGHGRHVCLFSQVKGIL